MTDTTPPKPRVIWRMARVLEATGVGRTTLYKLMNEGTFPKSRPLAGTGIVGWDSNAVEAWIAAQLDGEPGVLKGKKRGRKKRDGS